MHFEPTNPVIKLCADGMALEGSGPAGAMRRFTAAWDMARKDLEKFTAAHYLARHQPTVAEKLHWDVTALQFAPCITDGSVNGALPSLYLNIGKCHEDLGELENARTNYEIGLEATAALPDDGYGQMIRSGLQNGLARIGRDQPVPSLDQ